MGVVKETMQPSHILLWLHPDAVLKDKKKRVLSENPGATSSELSPLYSANLVERLYEKWSSKGISLL
jgi:hypothetical protein